MCEGGGGEAADGSVCYRLHPCCCFGVGEVEDWVGFYWDAEGFKVDCCSLLVLIKALGGWRYT